MKMRDVERKEKLYQMNLLMKVAQEKMKQEKLKILQQEMDQQWVSWNYRRKKKKSKNKKKFEMSVVLDYLHYMLY